MDKEYLLAIRSLFGAFSDERIPGFLETGKVRVDIRGGKGKVVQARPPFLQVRCNGRITAGGFQQFDLGAPGVKEMRSHSF